MAYVYFISGYLHGLSNNVSCPEGAEKFATSFTRYCATYAISFIGFVTFIIFLIVTSLVIVKLNKLNDARFFGPIAIYGLFGLASFITLLMSIINFFSGLSLLSSNLDDYIDECPEPEDDLGLETV